MPQIQFFKSIRFKIAAAFFVVFLGISLAFNYSLFQSIRNSLINAFQNGGKIEALSILNGVDDELTQIPVTQEDQPIQLWFGNMFESQMVYERPDFPEIFSSVFVEIEQPTSDERVSLMEFIKIDSFTYCIARRPLDESTGAQISLVLAKNNQVVYDEISALKSRLIFANLGAALIAFIAAVLIAHFTLAPLQKLIAKAQSVKASPQMDRLPVSSANDEITQLSATMNEMISRIETSIRSQNQFFAMAAHELRTPLANMQSELEYRMGSSEKELSQETLNSLREEVIRLKNIVQDFLLMSQLKSETLVLRKSDFRLDDLIYDMLERMRPTLSTKNFDIKLSINANPEELTINADREKLEGVLVNLFDNIRKYGASRQPVSVEISEQNEVLSLHIQNGIAENIDSLQKGMGLGLQIAKQVIEKHNYEFLLSKSKTKFTIEIVFYS
ncbi:HAMP domain-containing sensor histidine kinase [uncultured Roseivirga sp.]|uniref:sensor histidine kinase n=1 Tax=uncultured Roseivirga sp. TaxID=543088 RepID=UPI0030DBA082